MVMDELRDAGDIVGDATALRARIHDDGYVFVRGLLDHDKVERVGRDAAAALQAGAWTAPNADPVLATPLEPVHAIAMRDAIGDPAYREVATLEGFNQIPFLAPLEQLMHQIMGPSGFCYPRKVPRIVYPRSMVPHQPGATVHKDFTGVQDMFTCWVPLIDVPASLGGLAVLPGSQRWARFRPRTIERNEPSWVTTDYQPGDALIFHCLTTHAALPNDGAHLRLSAEYRWQLAEKAAPRFMVQGADGREFLSRRFRRTSWWHPVPDGLHLVDVDPRPEARRAGRRSIPEPSRFVDFALQPGPQSAN